MLKQRESGMTIQRKVVLPWGMQLHQLKRREFVTLLGSTAIAWPLAAYAQPDRWMRMRRVGVLMNTAADKTDAQVRLAAFLQGLQIQDGRSGATCTSVRAGAGETPPGCMQLRWN